MSLLLDNEEILAIAKKTMKNIDKNNNLYVKHLNKTLLGEKLLCHKLR